MKTILDNKCRLLRPETDSILQAHHADCEANYLRLQKLLGRFEVGVRAGVILLHDDREDAVSVEVRERSPYTALVDIAQSKAPWAGASRMHMQVRVYLDARMAEVVSCQGLRHFRVRYEYPNPKMFARDEKWQLNHFLGEWLGACLRHGSAELKMPFAAGQE